MLKPFSSLVPFLHCFASIFCFNRTQITKWIRPIKKNAFFFIPAFKKHWESYLQQLDFVCKKLCTLWCAMTRKRKNAFFLNTKIHLKTPTVYSTATVFLLNIFEIQLFHHSNPSGLLIHKQKPFENKLRISKDKCNFFSLSGTALSQGFSFITVIVTVQRTEQCNG